MERAGFRADEATTWPSVEGRLEYVGGRLLYMPPCGDIQQSVVPDVIVVLKRWADDHESFTVAGNEAGMCLSGEIRGADAAIWRRNELGTPSSRYRALAPVLAAEVAGEDDDEDETVLRDKARWYLDHGALAVWLVLPRSREVVIRLADGVEHRRGRGERLPEVPALPGLAPRVDDFFVDLDRRG